MDPEVTLLDKEGLEQLAGYIRPTLPGVEGVLRQAWPSSSGTSHEKKIRSSGLQPSRSACVVPLSRHP